MTKFQRATLLVLLATRANGYTWQLWARSHLRSWLVLFAIPLVWATTFGVEDAQSCGTGVIIGMCIGVFIADIRRFRGHRLAWPVWERVVNWTEAESMLNKSDRPRA